MPAKSALLILADGAEEMEAVIAIDVMRRANMEVVVASLSGNDIVPCSRGVNIKADKRLADVADILYDAVVLPGGGQCAKNLAGSPEVKAILKSHHKISNLIAAICASPTALAAHGIGEGKRVTCYPSMQHKMKDYVYIEKNVVRDGNILTSRGPGTAFEFALEIVTIIQGQTVADKLKEEMLLVWYAYC